MRRFPLSQFLFLLSKLFTKLFLFFFFLLFLHGARYPWRSHNQQRTVDDCIPTIMACSWFGILPTRGQDQTHLQYSLSCAHRNARTAQVYFFFFFFWLQAFLATQTRHTLAHFHTRYLGTHTNWRFRFTPKKKKKLPATTPKNKSKNKKKKPFHIPAIIDSNMVTNRAFIVEPS